MYEADQAGGAHQFNLCSPLNCVFPTSDHDGLVLSLPFLDKRWQASPSNTRRLTRIKPPTKSLKARQCWAGVLEGPRRLLYVLSPCLAAPFGGYIGIEACVCSYSPSR